MAKKEVRETHTISGGVNFGNGITADISLRIDNESDFILDGILLVVDEISQEEKQVKFKMGV